MANPSLQIGNNNWAIKEDNLLGYSTAGTRFVPQPITMTRATLGTRVNPTGLVEDVALLGSEEVVNGDFATDTDWIKGTGWSISNNRASYNGSGTGYQYILQSITTTSGKLYKINFDVLSSTGSNLNIVDFGSVRVNQTHLSVGNYTYYAEADATSENLFIYANGTDTFSITNVSVKEATIDNLPRVDYTDGTSSLLVEPQRTNLITYSEDFTSWNKLAAVVTTNQTTSPSGTLTADKITYDGTTYGRVEQTVAVTNGNTYSWSVYLKNNDLSDVTQVWLGFSLGGQGEFVTITNEWQRYETVQVANGSNEYPRVQFTGTGSLYAWGAQMEEGSYPTSYIKTSGSTVTRNQETYTKTGISDKIGQTEGTFFIELSKPVLETDGYYLISLNNAASNSDSNSVTIGFDDADDDFYIRLKASGINVFLDNLTSSLANTFYKIAVAYKSGQSKIYINGSPINPNQGSLSNTFTFAVTLDNLSFDYNGNGTLPFRGKVKQLQIFKTALSPSELATLTS